MFKRYENFFILGIALAAWGLLAGTALWFGNTDYVQRQTRYPNYESEIGPGLTPETDPEAFENPTLPVYTTKAAKTPGDAFNRSEVTLVIGQGCPPCRVVLANLIPGLVYRGWVVELVPNQTTPGGPVPRFTIRGAGWTVPETHVGLLTNDQFETIVRNHKE